MFICDKCKQLQPLHSKPILTVIEQREKVYPVIYAEDGKTILDNGGVGVETVKEVNLCQECAK